MAPYEVTRTIVFMSDAPTLTEAVSSTAVDIPPGVISMTTVQVNVKRVDS